MKKTRQRLLSVLMASICLTSAFSLAACGEENQKVDESKTQLSVYVYGGGLGGAWAEDVKVEFEKLYENYQGEDGKVGVQVFLDYEEKLEQSDIITGISSETMTYDVLYSENPNWKNYTTANVSEDITAVVNEKVYDEDGELAAKTGKAATKSMLDRMDDYFVKTYKSEDGKYYGFPFNDSIFGFIYDADMFTDYGYEEPKTMQEFYDLIDRIRQDGYTPFTWTGADTFYYANLIPPVIAQYGGKDLVSAHTAYNGKTVLKSTGETVDITAKNAYLLMDSEAVYKSLDYIQHIAGNSLNYSSNAFLGSQKMTTAQGEFLTSIMQGKRIAMLLDGAWWENEARPHFDDMAAENEEYGYGKRNFKFLPTPLMEGQAEEGKRYVFSMNCGAAAIISAKSGVKDLAGKWIQFQNSRSSLATFTLHTGTVLPYEYKLTDSEYASLTTFGKSIVDIYNDESVEILRSTSLSEYRDLSTFNINGICGDFQPNANNIKLTPLNAFRDNNMTVDKYYKALLNTYTKEKWEAEYRKICDRFNKEF